MARQSKYYIILVLCLLISCKHNSILDSIASTGYPKDPGVIILTKCAISGCHNNKSYEAAGGLNLTTWDNMFKGGSVGAVTIPYRPDFSTLCFFTNTYPDEGIILEPTMPLKQPALSRNEYAVLKEWIKAGAPHENGFVKFSDLPGRNKFYIANRLCDVVTVFDMSTLLQMRYIDVGNKDIPEFPYCIKVSPDRNNWYISFYAQSEIVQKFNAENDELEGEIFLGAGLWNSYEITPDSRFGYFVDNSNPGKILRADLDNRRVLNTYTFNGNFRYPSGIAIHNNLKKIYVGSVSGNFLYSIDITDPALPLIKEIPIDGSSVVKYESSLNPSELYFNKVTGLCYIACTGSNEIRILDMSKDSIVGRIALYTNPGFMCIVPKMKKLFVSCPDDVETFAGNRGSVAVIDMETNTIEKRINTGYQPYGLALNAEQTIMAVVNANIASEGPGSHHSSDCGDKNGNVTFIDLSILELIPRKKAEIAVFPYAAASR